MTEDQAAANVWWSDFFNAPDRIGWWLGQDRPPGETSADLAARITRFARSVADPGPLQGRLVVGVTHSPVLRSVLVHATGRPGRTRLRHRCRTPRQLSRPADDRTARSPHKLTPRRESRAMELVHDFSVPVPADQAWDLLIDVEKIAPCLPGAAITSVDGDTFEGGMKIKLGPIAMTFKGDGELVEKDAEARRAVIEARGQGRQGQRRRAGNGDRHPGEREGFTDVHVVTDLNVTGKAAQFGGGVMKDVSNRMLAQFADNLSQLIQSGGAGRSAVDPEGTRRLRLPAHDRGNRHDFTPNDDGLDAMGLLLGSEAVKNIVRPLAVGAAGLLVGYLYGKNRTLERIVRRVL